MKKGSFSEKLFYSLLQSAITLFHKVLRGQSPINLELQRKAQTLKYQRKAEILHTATWACTVFQTLQEASLDHKSAIIF